MTVLTLDFAQSYPVIAIVLYILSGLFLIFVELRIYRRIGLQREVKWCKGLGWTNVILGCCLFVGKWLHHLMWWI